MHRERPVPDLPQLPGQHAEPAQEQPGSGVAAPAAGPRSPVHARLPGQPLKVGHGLRGQGSHCAPVGLRLPAEYGHVARGPRCGQGPAPAPTLGAAASETVHALRPRAAPLQGPVGFLRLAPILAGFWKGSSLL